MAILVMTIGLRYPAHAQQRVINLSDYGIVANSYKNASAAIVRAIQDAKEGNCIIRFPGGRIDLWPEGAQHRAYYISNATEPDGQSVDKTVGMLFENMKHVVLEGNNTLLVFHGKMLMMAIDHCDDLKVTGLRFDYQRPTMSEMRIDAKTDSSVVVNINRDSWYGLEKEGDRQKLIWYGEGWKVNHPFVAGYNPSRQTMYYGSWKPFDASRAKEMSPFVMRFLGDFKDTRFEKGDILSIRDPYRDEVGIFNNCSHNVTFEDIDLYYIHGLGIVSQLSENILLKNVNVAPSSGSGRVVAAFADCFHFSGCYGLIKVENCLLSGSHDDPINVHGTYLRVAKADSNKIVVRFMHPQTWGFNAFEPGDTVELIDHTTLLAKTTAVVRSSRLLNKREIELLLDHPIAEQVSENDCVGNMSKTPEVVIRNNRFEHTLTRGLLITTRRPVLIEGNIFYRTGMHAILIADDCNSWFESGPVKNVMIRNNKFLDCAYNSFPDNYVIAIKPETDIFKPGKYVHSGISIVDNYFQIFDSPILFAKDVKGLVFSGNTVTLKKESGFPVSNKPALSLDHCGNVQVQDNSLGKDMPGNIAIQHMVKQDLKYSPKNEFKVYEHANKDKRN